MNGKDLILCRKNDSIMQFSNDDSPQDVYLAPRDFASYVLLINSARKRQTNNCRSMRSIVHGLPRVIIYSITTINAN